MRVDDEFVRCTGIETPIALRRFVETDDLHIDDFSYRKPIPQNGLHELAVVSQHRRLPGMDTVRLGPTETEAKAQLAMFCSFVLRSRIIRHIKSGNADRTRSSRDLHQTVEHHRRRFDHLASGTGTPGLEPDAIDAAVDLGLAQHIGDQFTESIMFSEVDRLEANLLCMGE